MASIKDDPLNIIKMRFAKGEITKEQFEKMKSLILEGTSEKKQLPQERPIRTKVSTQDQGTLTNDTHSSPTESVSEKTPNNRLSRSKIVYVIVGVIGIIVITIVLFNLIHMQSPSAYRATPTIATVTTVPQTLIPQSGVWAEINYDKTYSGRVGIPGNQATVTDTGNHFYRIPTDNGAWAISVQKMDASSDQLTVTVYNDGSEVTTDSTTSPNGRIDLPVSLATSTPTLAYVTQYVNTPTTTLPIISSDEIMAQKISQGIDYTNPIVKNFANAQVQQSHSGSNTIAQVCDVWESVNKQWTYVSDPPDFNYWTSASDSITTGLKGNCADYAILNAAVIEAIGGSARVVRTCAPGGSPCHAYAEDLLDSSQIQSIANYIGQRYGTKYVNWHTSTDSQGNLQYWLNLDWQANYPGGPFFQDDGTLEIFYPNGYYFTSNG